MVSFATLAIPSGWTEVWLEQKISSTFAPSLQNMQQTTDGCLSD